MKHEELRKLALKRAGVRTAYDELGPEFELLGQMRSARSKAGLTQAGVAERMGTHAPAVARLESALSSGRHSPSIATLKRYADAVGSELEIRLVSRRPPKTKMKAKPQRTKSAA